jgi:hypothetical protein
MNLLKGMTLAGGAAALILTGAVGGSFAAEPGTFNYLAGVSVGIPAGAAPPPGVYAGMENMWPILGGAYGNDGSSLNPTGSNAKLGSTIMIVPVIWSTGWSFLGASYSVAAIQPFTETVIESGGTVNNCTAVAALGSLSPQALCASQPLIINTAWQPINLSWNLGRGWFASLAFTFQAPDGSNYLGTANPDYWTFQPGAAISYLSANWMLSANMAYLIYTPSRGNNSTLVGSSAPGSIFRTAANGYTNGNQFAIDLTALYKLGKWSFGPVGDALVQTTNDAPGGGVSCGTLRAAATAGAAFGTAGLQCGNQTAFAAGALVGYDFGPADLQVWVTDQFYTKDYVGGGIEVWSRISFRLWGPETPKPVATKN